MGTKAFGEFIEGDEGPHNRRIKHTILQTTAFLVYLTDDLGIYWATGDEYEWKCKPGEILNRVNILESRVDHLFGGSIKIGYKKSIAEGLARVLDEQETESAKKVLDEVEKNIETAGKEVLRLSYLKGSIVATAFAMLTILLLWLFRAPLSAELTSNAFQILIASFGGGIGAFISTFIRSRTYNADIQISKSIHVFDGSMRVFYGLIAGLIVSMGIKSNFILGFINSIENYSNSFSLLFFLAAISGASESLIPNLIKQVEEKTIQ